MSVAAHVMGSQSVQNTDANEKEIISNGINTVPIDAVQQRLNRLREKFARQKNLSPLHSIIEDEVKRAFEVCGITEPMIVLQNLNSTNSACYPLVDELYYPVKALVVGVEDHRGACPLPLIRHSIFHECGHLVAGDVDQNIKKHIPSLLINGSLSICAAILAAKVLKDSPKIVRILGGMGIGFMSLFGLGRLYHKTIGAYQTRKIEYEADVFAAQKLISLHDYHTIAYGFLDLTYNCDEGKRNWKNEHWFFHDHPEYIERARIILDELKKANIDLNNLPLDSHLDKQEVQERFSNQIKKYFPEFLNE
jgi:hypothetical protein